MDEAPKRKAEQLASDIAAQAQALDDLHGLMRALMKSALERMPDTERDTHLGRNAESALKRVYLAIHEASRRWTTPIVGWKAALSHFAIVFADRLPQGGKN